MWVDLLAGDFGERQRWSPTILEKEMYKVNSGMGNFTLTHKNLEFLKWREEDHGQSIKTMI